MGPGRTPAACEVGFRVIEGSCHDRAMKNARGPYVLRPADQPGAAR